MIAEPLEFLHVLRVRRKSLRLGIGIWISHAVAMVLWLANNYFEQVEWILLLLQSGYPSDVAKNLIESHLTIMGALLMIFLPFVVESGVYATILLYAYRKTCRVLDDYLLRIEITRTSPRAGETYSTIAPVIYPIRDLLRNTGIGLGLVSAVSLIRGIGFMRMFILFAYSPPITPHLILVRRLILSGMNAILFWSFMLWAVVDLSRTYPMYKRLTKSYEIEGLVETRALKEFKNFQRSYAADFRTTDGTFVRSRAEKVIADWLHSHGIRYDYERKITEGVVADFYLPDANLYIEYWGLTDESYRRARDRKERFYSENRLRLLSLDNEDLKRIDEVLRMELSRAGLSIRT